MDFINDSLYRGKHLKILNIIDEGIHDVWQLRLIFHYRQSGLPVFYPG